MTQLAVFDYSSLVPDVREFLILKEKTIKYRMATSIIDTGRDLIEAKEKCGHGTFLPWVNHAFGMSKERAAEYMRVAKEFNGIDSNLLDQFGKSALVMLSSRSMPAEVKEKAFDLAESGEHVSADVVKKLREEISLLEHHNAKKDMEIRGLSRANENLEFRLDELENQVPEVKVIEKEVLVDVVPEDYDSLKSKASQVDSVLEEIDDLRDEMNRDRKEFDDLRIEQDILTSVVRIHDGIELIHTALNVPGVDGYRLSVSDQFMIADCIRFLLPMISVVPGLEYTDKCSRDKLLRSGFTLIRPDDENNLIKKYDGSGVWSVHSRYDNRKSYRDALKSLSADDMVILA
ncbi:MAG: DUF3102 domain-containing protein [Desulfococcaceae bacterium]